MKALLGVPLSLVEKVWESERRKDELILYFEQYKTVRLLETGLRIRFSHTRPNTP